MEVILYSTHCPQCVVLEKKLNQKNISYEEVNDVKIIREKGFLSVPMLEVDGKNMNFKEAFNYVESL